MLHWNSWMLINRLCWGILTHQRRYFYLYFQIKSKETRNIKHRIAQIKRYSEDKVSEMKDQIDKYNTKSSQILQLLLTIDWYFVCFCIIIRERCTTGLDYKLLEVQVPQVIFKPMSVYIRRKLTVRNSFCRSYKKKEKLIRLLLEKPMKKSLSMREKDR